jgi:hypothetical protein
MVWRQQRVTARRLASPMAKGRDQCSRVLFQHLEMAGVLLQEAVLEATIGPSAMIATQTAIACDNSPAVAWTSRMASRSASPVSYRLLRGLAMRQRLTCSAPPAVFHIAGVQNTMADVASRAVKGVATPFHLLDKSPSVMCPETFLTHFNSTYPLPQTLPWTNVQPPSALWSKVILTLRGQRLPLRQWTITLEPARGKIGPTMPKSITSTPGCATIPSPPNKLCRPGSLWNLRQCGPGWTPNCGNAPSRGTNPPSGRVR